MNIDGRRTLLIGRQPTFGQASRMPLGIDLESFEVRLIPLVAKRSVPGYVSGTTFLSQGGSGIEKFTRKPDGHSWNVRRIVLNTPGELMLRHRLLPYQNKVYAPGSRWYSFNTEALKPEALTPVPLPLSSLDAIGGMMFSEGW